MVSLRSLDLDIVHTVTTHLAPADALPLALTCRDAYATVMPRVLSEVVLGHWRTSCAEQVSQFCSFVLSDVKQRPQHLKSLTLYKEAFKRARGAVYWDPDYDYGVASSLARTLYLTTQLRTVRIHQADVILASAPEIAEALTSLPHIDEIILTEVGSQCLALLSSMKSRPRFVELGIREYSLPIGEFGYGPFTAGEDRFLPCFTDSLVRLALLRYPDIVGELEPRTRWPALRDLSLQGTINNFSSLTSAFPNLRVLRVQSDSVDESNDEACWRDLDHVTTQCPIPLHCPVRRLEIRYDLDLVTDTLLPIWRPGTTAMLVRTSPVVLACSPSIDMLRFIGTRVRSLRFIQIFTSQVIVTDTTPAEDMTSWITSRIAFLREVPLEGITVARRVGEEVSEAQLRGYASSVAAEVPTLQYVGVDLAHITHVWEEHVYEWYHVASRLVRTQPVMEKLSTWKGNEIEKRMLDHPRIS